MIGPALRRIAKHGTEPEHGATAPRRSPRRLARAALWASCGAALLLGSAGAAEPATYNLRVQVTDVDNEKGVVAVALFDSAESFPNQKKARAGALAKITGRTASVVFRDLAPGVYAVAVLHDENQNAKMDFNFVGMPLEGYGFSNDAPVSFGPPSYAAAAFKLEARHSRLPIKMRYFMR